MRGTDETVQSVSSFHGLKAKSNTNV